MKHLLNGVEIAPRNLNDIGVVSNFGDIPNELELNVDKLVLPREAYNIIENHVNTLGVFEGIPYEVIMNSGVHLQYYVDLTEETLYRHHEIEVKIKRRNAKDSFFDRADGSSFEWLNKNGANFNLKSIPYVIIQDNQEELFFNLALSTFILTKELIYAADQIVQSATEIISATVPDVGATGPTIQTGDIINMALKITARIVYFAAVVVAVIKLGQDLLALLFPKVRYLKACNVKELIEKSCQYLGYNVQSQLLNDIENYTILPIPLMSKTHKWYENLGNDLTNDFNKGYPTAQDTVSTLGSLIRSIEIMFNAKTRVYDGVVYLERRDFWQNLSQNIINPALNIQSDRDEVYKYNTQDIWKRYYIHYQVDFSDTHTTDDFDSTDAEFSCEPVNVVNQDIVTIKGLNDVNINFALGKRKDKLNFIESAAAEILMNIDLVANVFGGNSSIASLITNRIGVLQISQQFFSVTKMLYTLNDGKQPQNYKDYIRASYLWDNYHYINQIQLNNYKIKENARVRLSDQDFVNLLTNNFAQVGNQVVEILKIEYIDSKSYSLISYREFDNYAQGKVSTLTINI